MHDLNPGDQDSGAAEGLEAEHRTGDSFDSAVVLLDEVVELLRLAHLDGQAAVGLDSHDGGRVGAAEGTKCFFGAICGSGPITTLIPGLENTYGTA